MSRARRHPLRLLRGPSRRELLTVCLWLVLQVVCPALAQEISQARYFGPTAVYPHGALGDELEWSGVRITLSRSKVNEAGLLQGNLDLAYEIKAPANMVFEDIEPRLWDVDGDGSPEVVVVLSHFDYGAQLAVIGYRNKAFRYIATTPLIGQRFRWLAPVGAADLDNDGHVELVFVHTPHLSKTLHIWRYKDGKFAWVAQTTGLTNHKIGWNHIPGGIRVCSGRAEIITANAGWTSIFASRLESGQITTQKIAPYRSPEGLNAALACP